jgi:alpha-glucosidase
MPGPTPWWKSAVVYQIYPRSFLDTAPVDWADRGERYAAAFPPRAITAGDGVGDLEGIRRRLGYLVELGVDAIWLSPFFTSPMADFGYDVADFCDVDPLFGTMADFDRLLAEAHQRGLRVLVDWVPHHTSDRHPWFVDARTSRTSARRDWYVWRNDRSDTDGGAGPPGSPGRRPNNWLAAFGGPAWTWDEATGQWYLHLFLPEQPDLNWSNPEVVAAMHDVLRFWLDRGVDGFRMDVIHALGKDPALPDAAPGAERMPIAAVEEPAYTHELLRGIRALLDSYPGDRVSVGEVYLLSTRRVARFYGTPEAPELHLSFNFPPLYAPWEAAAWRHRVDRVVEELDPIKAWPTWVLSNHDNPRHRTRYGGDERRARAAAVLLACLRGTPFLYAGEELGLENAQVPPDRVVDPGGRDGCRAPLPWDASPQHGWPTADPWLPWPPEPSTHNADSEAHDPASTLSLYRRLLAARRASAALRTGSFTWLPTPGGVLAWLRSEGNDHRVALVNFKNKRAKVPLEGRWFVAVSSLGPTGEGQAYSGVVGPSEALVLRPDS